MSGQCKVVVVKCVNFVVVKKVVVVPNVWVAVFANVGVVAEIVVVVAHQCWCTYPG